MSAVKKERTPEQIEAAKARMAAVRAKRGSKPKSFLKEGHRNADPVQLSKKDLEDSGALDVPKKWAKPKEEHRRSASIPNEFEGISAKDCCDSCYASKGERCAITHRGLCGHPMKGGLQQPDQMRPDTVARYQRAKKILAHAKIEAA